MRYYVSFGQEHVHSIDGHTFDKDSLMLVDGTNSLGTRLGVNRLCGGKWAFIYGEAEMPAIVHHFPRGVVNPDKPITV